MSNTEKHRRPSKAEAQWEREVQSNWLTVQVMVRMVGLGGPRETFGKPEGFNRGVTWQNVLS